MQNGEALSSAVICTRVQVVLFSKFQLSLLELSLVPVSSLGRGEGSYGSRSRDWETSGDVGPLLPASNSNLILSLPELSLVPESSLLRGEGSYSGGSRNLEAGNNVGPLLPSSSNSSQLGLVPLCLLLRCHPCYSWGARNWKVDMPLASCSRRGGNEGQ